MWITRTVVAAVVVVEVVARRRGLALIAEHSKLLSGKVALPDLRKKRQAALGIKPEKKIRKSNSSDSSDLSLDHHRNDKNKINKDYDHISSSSSSDSSKRVSKFLELGLEVPVMKRSAVEKKRLWKKLGDEERATVLLMALFCGYVYA
ncbi:hypothetical protein N665_0332s0016 [Sinapis alba]|nr:hypothetical protein N665_0332s0016 [Sinapis alba]